MGNEALTDGNRGELDLRPAVVGHRQWVTLVDRDSKEVIRQLTPREARNLGQRLIEEADRATGGSWLSEELTQR